MMQRAFSLILFIVLLVTGPAHAAASKKFPSSFNFLRLKSSTGVKAPLVIEPGVLTPSSEDGSIEFDGNDLYITKSGVKTVLGTAGAKGEKGDKGDTGERGPRGLSGPSGPAGASGSFSGGDAVVSGILSFSTGRLQGAILNGTSLFRTNSIAKFNGSILIPSNAANGKVLTSNGGGLASWKTLPTSTPGGSSGQIQINNSGSFAGNGSLFWDFTNKRLGIGTSTPAQAKVKIVLGSAAEQGLVLQAAASQTGNLTEWRDSTGTALASTSSAGAFTAPSYTLRDGASAGGLFSVSGYPQLRDYDGVTRISLQSSSGPVRIIGKTIVGATNYFTPASATAQLDILAGSAATVATIIKGAASQTANLTEWQNSAGTILTYVSPNGSIYLSSGGEYRSGNSGWFENYPFVDWRLGGYTYGLTLYKTYNTGYIALPSYSKYSWSSTSSSNGTQDTSLERESAGVVSITSGTAGQYRDLKARKVSMTSALRLEPLTGSQPSSPSMGDMYSDGDTGTLCYYDGSSWVAVAGGTNTCN